MVLQDGRECINRSVGAGAPRCNPAGCSNGKPRKPVRVFALIFALALATVQVIFIDAYFRWLGAGFPLPALGAVFLVGVPVVVELYGAEIRTRYPATAPLLAQARSALWQVINAV